MFHSRHFGFESNLRYTSQCNSEIYHLKKTLSKTFKDCQKNYLVERLIKHLNISFPISSRIKFNFQHGTSVLELFQIFLIPSAAKFETQPRSLFTLTPTSGVSCWLWKINPYFKLTSYPPQMSSWYVKLNLKHIPHAWIIKHFNWTQFHNPKIKVFYIPRIIHHLFGQVDRKRTQFTVPNWMDFLGRRSNFGLTKKKSLTRDYGRRKRFKLSTFVSRER